MSTPTNPDRDRSGPPTVREIAELTARLRALSTRGRDADPVERAAFLADKQALLDRIPDPGLQRAEPEVVVQSRVDARFLMDGDRIEHDGRVHVVDDVPIAYDGVLTVPTRAGDEATWLDLPADEWVVLHDRTDQAEDRNDRAGEREWVCDGPSDDAPRRMAAMDHERWPPSESSERGTGPHTHAAIPNRGTTLTEAAEADRRAQLAAWHADDYPDGLSSGEEHTICGPDPVREW